MAPPYPAYVMDKPFPDGKRIEHQLVFIHDIGVITREISIPFEEDRITLWHEGKLYDWYGRKVELDDNIAQIIEFYSGSSFNNEAHEQFIVRKKDGRLAIARLRYRYSEAQHSSIPVEHKDILTGRMLGRTPVLECEKYDFYSIDRTILLEPVFETLIKNIGKELTVFYDVRKGHESYHTVIRRRGNDFYPWIYNCFSTASREEILKLPPDIAISEHRYVSWLDGWLDVSKDGRKMTSMTIVDDRPYYISTDVEILEHRQSRTCIWWYPDPGFP